jgi:Tfp pilus assembly protein PilV
MSRISLKQAGFTLVETGALVLFLAVIGLAGYLVAARHNNATKPLSASQQAKTATVPTAPAVQNTSDLTKAQQTLDQTNVDAASNDSSQLDSQLSGL